VSDRGAKDDGEAALMALIEKDPITALCQVLRDAGLTMTLYGVPVTEGELRKKALDSAMDRLAAAVAHATPEVDE
jgi:hypothetical protein